MLGRGSIPAWAGEPYGRGSKRRWGEVYPRVGGGTARTWEELTGDSGLSPRGRGNRRRSGIAWAVSRSIPAWAGEPPPGLATPRGDTVYPRVGGGTRWLRPFSYHMNGLSPRGRGNRRFTGRRVRMVRSIPAWAGEPLRGIRRRHRHEVYPRVGGGTPADVHERIVRDGLSPRGRGNRVVHDHVEALDRSIPAWAGEPPGSAPGDGR